MASVQDLNYGVGNCSGDGGGPVGEGSLVEMPGRVALHETGYGFALGQTCLNFL